MTIIVRRYHLDEMQPRYCANGSRRWCARIGLDWAVFVREGIAVEALEATGDAMALKLAEHVRGQHGSK